ncbi:Uncharacterised protein [uncultured archaeon]|nr:Uncharacterised protein [uncultured archaeon]
MQAIFLSFLSGSTDSLSFTNMAIFFLFALVLIATLSANRG